VDTDVVRAAYECGQRAFGENRVQELERKHHALPEDCEWHMIGHLQSNKARIAVQNARWIHSVDSLSLIKRLDRIAAEENAAPNFLVQVNVSGEESKYGVSPEKVPRLLEGASACGSACCRGLMTMAPFGAPSVDLHRIFGDLRRLRDRLSAEFGLELPELSMGMTADFAEAIAEGATMVRIGTAVFGPRA
jgi:pyridoxal phosphate enzyme (YggS family)